MTVLADLNILLDIFLNRLPWATDAAAVWQANTDGRARVAVAAFSLPTLYYIIRRQTDRATALAAVRSCLSSLTVVPVDHSMLLLADTYPSTDYEDNLQLACAIQ